jgi:hypothetical protein
MNMKAQVKGKHIEQFKTLFDKRFQNQAETSLKEPKERAQIHFLETSAHSLNFTGKNSSLWCNGVGTALYENLQAEQTLVPRRHSSQFLQTLTIIQWLRMTVAMDSINFRLKLHGAQSNAAIDLISSLGMKPTSLESALSTFRLDTVPELQLHWTIQLPVMNTRPFRTIY